MKPDTAQLFGSSRTSPLRRLRPGFTLIELLVVIAITAVLFFLLVRPLIESLRLTQRAQLQAAAQDSARKTLEIISRELASAVYVFDNASHPFTLPAGTTPTANDTLFTNFLDLDVPNDPTGLGTTDVAHAFNAKLDFVPARRSASGGLVDPTTGDPISTTQSGSGSATLNTTGLQFPLAPGTTIIRYFVGLKDPTISYRNTAERLGLNTTGNPKNVDNTYILYRVQFPLYKKDPITGAYSVNSDLLRTNTATGKPELDDPDFFRYVLATDPDWLSSDHVHYGGTGAESVANHDARVDNWIKIAKPVITAPNIDLLVLPRYADGTPIYDVNHVPSSGSTTDPVRLGVATPTVKTSITFAPATVTADAAPSSSSEYGSLGVPMNAADNGGLPYVPTVYTASSASWGFPPHITLASQGALSAAYYTTDTNPTSLTSPGAASISNADPGDLMEYYNSTDAKGKPVATPVYDITKGCVIAASGGAATHNYVPMAVNPDTGTISFDTPALPAPNNQASKQTGGYLPYNRYWTASAADINTGSLASCPPLISNPTAGTPGVLDLTTLPCDTNGNLAAFGSTGVDTSPLPKLGTSPIGLQCANAFIVPGSVRVYGPDQAEGPNKGNSILYTQASPSVSLTYNQYRVDYRNSLLIFNVDAGNQLPTVKADKSSPPDPANPADAADPVKITFNYQANLSPADSTNAVTKPLSGTNPASPLLVKVDYRTRDLLDINIGVRVYDPTNGQAFIVPVSNRVKVNNSNR